MKVLIYTQSFAPVVGGVETYVMLLAQGLMRRLTHEATLESTKSPRVRRGAQKAVTVVTATPTSRFDDSEFRFSVVRRPRIPTLWQLVGDTDVLHLAGPVLLPLILGLLRRKPIVIEHHGYQAICPNGLLLDDRTKAICPGYFMRRRYDQCLACGTAGGGWLWSLRALLLTFPRRVMCRGASANVTVSRHVLDRVQLPRSRVIYHGLPDPFVDSPTAAPDVEPRSPLTIAYVGRLVGEKGLRFLLEAARRLKSGGYTFRLKVVGDGPERGELESLASHLNVDDRVEFTGFLRGVALHAAIAQVEVLVMPSIWEETAGLAAMEHMMRGRAVIVSDIGGLGEVVGRAGLKFAPGDVAGLVGALRAILNDRSIAVELGRQARDRAVHVFSQDRMVDEHVTLYRELLDHTL